ncbi:T9SS type A sorting domain-containing protein [Aureispira anguillae]|uniref:T9SS type A sorting domain-containing protein n=1 Tax=Aureispira anguillae TaxID=2864201 RepID=A0A915YAC8_9BACT|nr:T9SS type A sorting domain-containing protein [Aureispira anguillae]BDS09437.1 T9SS type A sorting domain-containing protein [Aureispira anguillae]
MKYLYIALVLLITQANLQAQTYTIQPNDTVSTILALNTYTDLNIELLKVNPADSVTLGYTVVHNDMPASWDQLLCVYGLCVGSNFPVGTNGTMSPLTGGNRGFVKLTINPLSLDQSAMFQMYVYDINNPTNGDTLTYLIEATTPIGYLENDHSLSVYPNPATNQIQLESDKDWIHSVEIYALNGQLVQTETSLHTQRLSLNIEDLEQGIYTIKTSTTNNAIRIQKLIVK